jgi:hypothetical protein
MRTVPARGLFLLLLLMALPGCQMAQYGTFTREVPLAGGQTEQVQFVHGLAVTAENEDFRVGVAGLRPAGQNIFLLFSIYSKRDALPRRVKVEDVSENGAEVFVDDLHPGFLADPNSPGGVTRTWAWQKGPLIATDWRPTWFHDPDESVRLYRFTIVTSDGREEVLDQAMSYPASVKKFILKALPDKLPVRKDSAEVVPMGGGD